MPKTYFRVAWLETNQFTNEIYQGTRSSSFHLFW